MSRWTTLWLGLAVVSSLALIVAGFALKSYTPTSGPSLTLIQENGTKVLAPLSLPFVYVAIVALTLRHRRRTNRSDVGVLVWIVMGLMAVLVVLGAFTVGPFIAPIAVFVLLAISSFKPATTSLDVAAR